MEVEWNIEAMARAHQQVGAAHGQQAEAAAALIRVIHDGGSLDDVNGAVARLGHRGSQFVDRVGRNLAAVAESISRTDRAIGDADRWATVPLLFTNQGRTGLWPR